MNEPELSACPYCSETIAPGASLCRFCNRGIDPAQFSPCPLCREMVRKEATACRFCQGKIVQNPGAGGYEPPPVKPEVAPGKDQVKDQVTREGGMPKFYLPQLGKLFRPPKDAPQQSGGMSGSYGASVREQVLEVIVRQALAGAPWREICAGPMNVNNITPQEVEAEVQRRTAGVLDTDQSDLNALEHNMLKSEKLIKRMLRIADDITVTQSQSQRNNLAEDIRELVRQLTIALEIIKEHAENSNLTNAILQSEVDMYGTKYDAILDLLNGRDKLISDLKEKLKRIEEEDQ